MYLQISVIAAIILEVVKLSKRTHVAAIAHKSNNITYVATFNTKKSQVFLVKMKPTLAQGVAPILNVTAR